MNEEKEMIKINEYINLNDLKEKLSTLEGSKVFMFNGACEISTTVPLNKVFEAIASLEVVSKEGPAASEKKFYEVWDDTNGVVGYYDAENVDKAMLKIIKDSNDGELPDLTTDEILSEWSNVIDKIERTMNEEI